MTEQSKLPLTAKEIDAVRGWAPDGLVFSWLCEQARAAITLEARVRELEKDARQIRNDTIEVCAKVCDFGVKWTPPLQKNAEWQNKETARLLAQAIRRLPELVDDVAAMQKEKP